jgi:glutamine amidotransferase
MIAIISACGANFNSIQFALKRLGKSSILTNDPDAIRSASHVILPGVGTAHYAMNELHKKRLVEVIRGLQQPVLGICLGMQLLHAFSAEGEVDTLGLMPGHISPLVATSTLTVPHMGWNRLHTTSQSPLLKDICNGSYVYYAHSYAAPIHEKTIATTEYGKRFTAIVQQRNFYGVQFHPERSATSGEILLKNFTELT